MSEHEPLNNPQDDGLSRLRQRIIETINQARPELDAIGKPMPDSVMEAIIQNAAEELRAEGVELDSLDIAAVSIDPDNPLDNPEDTGGTGVREPRRPLPSLGSGSAEIPLKEI